MAHQILWFETILKFSAGIALLALPVSLARVFGLPHGNIGFWPRLLGGVLIGLAGAIYVEASQPNIQGLGFTGLVIINISAILLMISLIIMKQIETWRGNAALWAVCGVLLLLSMFEIAQIEQ
ncbi:MAG: hypothetical protein AAGD43_23925 [Pseudomonadota bacterium]